MPAKGRVEVHVTSHRPAGDKPRERANQLTQLLPQRRRLIQISLVLLLVLNLLLQTLEDPHGGAIIVDPPGSLEGLLDDLLGGDEVVGETVVEASLEFEEVLDGGEEGCVTLVEGVVGFFFVSSGGVLSETGDCRFDGTGPRYPGGATTKGRYEVR